MILWAVYQSYSTAARENGWGWWWPLVATAQHTWNTRIRVRRHK